MIKDEFQDLKNEILDTGYPDTFTGYLQEFGSERAQGYIDAMEQMLKDFDKIFYDRITLKSRFPSNANGVRKKLTSYRNEKECIVPIIKKHISPK